MTAAEVKAKLFNLVSEYRKEKKAQGSTGGGPCSWRFFDQIDQVIGRALFSCLLFFSLNIFHVYE